MASAKRWWDGKGKTNIIFSLQADKNENVNSGKNKSTISASGVPICAGLIVSASFLHHKAQIIAGTPGT